ncbi:MAG TPA: precorrin-6Y C5,15-methyltransferase (decarboxylating) subunit CbiT [Methylomusa anaerophila]|uniref:Putative cobalt-precorrin-6Y C(15)-methyltransferase [decarboxylating] n=1 Tax=Methylomusa anaerophila TaxID=1930071 RepID=A0A348AQE5_9FIRM|nr:precorrin-6Y C5,15-methyltransferase (decarboxylating) subunit CbiT [Methylomusa anaerophila]BBB93293.1 putative cobalt-precorrin-6Y C(15)-methyltransferase [decarboxylating] [Methylomusa anaerophila]HML86876.1 precorrin-6Y C5,15-methyltransferase (decarboxylating) subunit CbiT [Methylomusa anaerophila]
MRVYNPGIADDDFIRGDIPMTKAEIRILTLSKAKIRYSDIIIDIGAGTGSLSVEAALMAPQGHVTAIERKEEGIKLIKANAVRFGVENLEPVLGEAPEALSGHKEADVILVGGSGGRLPEILAKCDKILKPGGRLVITAVTVETLSGSLLAMRQRIDYSVEAVGAQITRIQSVGSNNMFQALNPIYIVTCTKKP